MVKFGPVVWASPRSAFFSRAFLSVHDFPWQILPARGEVAKHLRHHGGARGLTISERPGSVRIQSRGPKRSSLNVVESLAKKGMVNLPVVWRKDKQRLHAARSRVSEPMVCLRVASKRR